MHSTHILILSIHWAVLWLICAPSSHLPSLQSHESMSETAGKKGHGKHTSGKGNASVGTSAKDGTSFSQLKYLVGSPKGSFEGRAASLLFREVKALLKTFVYWDLGSTKGTFGVPVIKSAFCLHAIGKGSF